MAPTSSRPRIAVTCDAEVKIDSRGSEVPRIWLNEAYVTALNQAGADAYLFAPTSDITPQRAQALLAPMQGLVITGGAFDIDPERYGEILHPLCGPLMPTRTTFEAQLLQAAETLHLPVLGICGGMQLMVVQHGGTLYQDLSLRPGTRVHEQPTAKSLPFHAVKMKAGSRLAMCYGIGADPELSVNSTHHQIVRTVGSLEAVGHSPDGVIEAIEKAQELFYLGVQWHPESLADGSGAPLYQALVEAARKH